MKRIILALVLLFASTFPTFAMDHSKHMQAAPKKAVKAVYGKYTGYLVLGDCIATYAGLGSRFPGAKIKAAVGIDSGKILELAEPAQKGVILSAGSNDVVSWMNPKLQKQRQLRLLANLKLIAKKVGPVPIYYVQPFYKPAGDIVKFAALQRGNNVIPFIAGKDRVHPANYNTAANGIKAVMP